MSHQPCPCPRVRRRRRRWRGGARSGARGQAGEAGARVYMREAGGGWGGRKSCAARQCQLQTWKGWVRSIKLEVARPSQEGRHHPSQAKGKLETTASGEEKRWNGRGTPPNQLTNQPPGLGRPSDADAGLPFRRRILTQRLDWTHLGKGRKEPDDPCVCVASP